MGSWGAEDHCVLVLPSGRRIRGRSLRAPAPAYHLPDFAVYLLTRPPRPVPWAARWVCWPDMLLPLQSGAARHALTEAWARADVERVEVACTGGRGRTGTALACVAILDGVPPHDAVAYVRTHYDARAVETPWQRRYVSRFRVL